MAGKHRIPVGQSRSLWEWLNVYILRRPRYKRRAS